MKVYKFDKIKGYIEPKPGDIVELDGSRLKVVEDAPRLGKTLTTICLAEELKAKYNIEHCLVVCGLNTLKTNWKREIEMHSKYTARILGERVGKRSGKVTYAGTAERLQGKTLRNCAMRQWNIRLLRYAFRHATFRE